MALILDQAAERVRLNLQWGKQRFQIAFNPNEITDDVIGEWQEIVNTPDAEDKIGLQRTNDTLVLFLKEWTIYASEADEQAARPLPITGDSVALLAFSLKVKMMEKLMDAVLKDPELSAASSRRGSGGQPSTTPRSRGRAATT